MLSLLLCRFSANMPGKKLLVTGASGFLGGRLCHELLNQGHHVKAFDLRPSNLSLLPSSTGDLELVLGDITDYQSLLQASSDCHVIFHGAALVEPWVPDPSKFFAVNIGGLKNVLQVYKEAGTIEKIIYTSSFFDLGSTDGYVADESQMHSGKFYCSEYEKSKALADKIALEIYGWVSILISRITGKLPLISPPVVDVLRHQWAYSCDKAKEELDYNPRSLNEGLSEMLPWLKKLGLIKY